ncbi:MAG: hypothetical protein RIQ59_903 [Bacteroidota bacterium]|jgi:hypothetical protein
MKKVYLIQYHSVDNQLFETKVKSLGEWVKYFSDNWIVSSELSAQEIYDKITEGFENKSIIIIEMSTENYYGRMDPKIWNFLKMNKKKKL